MAIRGVARAASSGATEAGEGTNTSVDKGGNVVLNKSTRTNMAVEVLIEFGNHYLLVSTSCHIPDTQCNAFCSSD